MLNPDEHYDNSFQPDNVYGHALTLLERHRAVTTSTAHDGSVHLDLGCGFGRIAEPLTERLGVHYIGIDGALAGVDSLRSRGFEAHQLLFDTEEQTLGALRSLLAGRAISSLSMLDTLEHLPNGDMMLRVIHALIRDTNAPAIVSVPNVAHRDIGFRLAFGKWAYTREGLLDHTHTRLFSRSSLTRTVHAAGLHIVDSNDVRISQSDQHFPTTSPVLAAGSALHSFMSYLRDGVDDTANVNQFVLMLLAGPATVGHSYLNDEERHPSRPFISLVTRTQGTRPHCLVELLTALAGQKDRDFELLIVGHKLSVPQQKVIERIIDDCPEWLRRATRLIRENEGNRTRPLNRGFAEARGEYISILDDDDLPMAHWISTFHKLAQKHPGTILRAIAARQDVDIVHVRQNTAVRATGGLSPYPAAFDLFAHLVTNETPPIALAFPRGLFHDLNITFDETLTTTEDWDFLLRGAVVVGVSAVEEITSVYRWWTLSEESSRTVHSEREWTENYYAIHRKLNNLPILLPPGAARQLRELANAPYPPLPAPERAETFREIANILTSRSWRWSAPLRWPSQRRGRADPTVAALIDMDSDQLASLLKKLRRSSSWKVTRLFHGDKRK